MTLRQSLSVAAVGAAIGLAAASMLTRFLRTLLFEVSHLDITTFVLAGAGLLTIVLLASVVPARRAARVNPALLLRSEKPGRVITAAQLCSTSSGSCISHHARARR